MVNYEYFNPIYRVNFTVKGEPHVMEMKAIVNMDIQDLSEKLDIWQLTLRCSVKSQFEIDVNKPIPNSKFVSFVDKKTFNNVQDVKTYVQQWQNKADS